MAGRLGECRPAMVRFSYHQQDHHYRRDTEHLMSTITTTTAPVSTRAQAYLDAVGVGVGIQHVGWTSDVTTAAAHKARKVRKVVTATVMVGVKYADLAVLEGRETGPLPWGHWVVSPHLIGHTGKDGVYREFARLYPVEGTVRATYTIDGVPASKADVDALLTEGARKPKDAPTAITVKMDNLTIL